MNGSKTPPHVFISHSTQDKAFVRKLVSDLKELGIKVWLDETEILPGESILEKISDGIKDTNYLLVVLSKASVASPWVRSELNAALFREINHKGMIVLPAKIDDCEVPPLLQDRLYVDFRASYLDALDKLRRALGLELVRPQVSYSEYQSKAPVSPSNCPSRCLESISGLEGHDLRRRIYKCLGNSINTRQLGITCTQYLESGWRTVCQRIVWTCVFLSWLSRQQI